jgi:UrcA family protein
MSFRHVLLVAAALVAGLANVAIGVSPASARSPANQVAVSYADLNLDSAAGQNTLDRRIAGAVQQLCGASASQRTVLNDGRRQCADQAFASASAQRDALNHRHPTVSVSSAAR